MRTHSLEKGQNSPSSQVLDVGEEEEEALFAIRNTRTCAN